MNAQLLEGAFLRGDRVLARLPLRRKRKGQEKARGFRRCVVASDSVHSGYACVLPESQVPGLVFGRRGDLSGMDTALVDPVDVPREDLRPRVDTPQRPLFNSEVVEVPIGSAVRVRPPYTGADDLISGVVMASTDEVDLWRATYTVAEIKGERVIECGRGDIFPWGTR